MVKIFRFIVIDKHNFKSFRVGPVAKLYRKEIIDKYEIKFPENIYQEDEAFYWFYMTKINSVYVAPEALYYRLMHKNSVMYEKDNILKLSQVDNFKQEVFEELNNIIASL